jgi:hypothetical protein
MPLSWNEIKTRAVEFSKEWENESREEAEAKSFWDGFFNVFGITRKRVAAFETYVKKLGNKEGFIDLFWPGTLIVEHKSKGKDLTKAYEQALDYFHGLKESELPKYVLVSDFYRFKLYDLETGKAEEFNLTDLHKKAELFGFIAGYQKQIIRQEDPANQKAAELMAGLHDSLYEAGYSGHNLEVFLVRILFCLFADDTGIFPIKNQFYDYIEWTPKEDGSDFGLYLQGLFDVLNTPNEKRQKNLDERLQTFPYVNGGLFKENLPVVSFNSEIRKAFLKACEFDWSQISPAIFGSMFQGVMDKKERRALGAHYTSETNILKLIKPLFLDELWAEFEDVKNNRLKIQDFQKKLASLKFLDPACGCGNFLIIAYRELRLLELEILKSMYGPGKSIVKFNIQSITQVSPEQFYGIEIGEFAGRIAETAMWLVDHQINQKASEALGQYFVRLPLDKAAHIKIGNALRLDWKEVIKPEELNYILGNPPFIGKKEQTKEQKADLEFVFSDAKGANILDYVTCWYYKALEYMHNNATIRAAFVSTNSITQGEQVGVFWGFMLKNGAIIHFAHRTFAWGNEAKGKAAVHCVIIGFGLSDVEKKYIFEYENIKSEPHSVLAKTINPYLVAAENILLERRSKPLSNNAPEMVYGSMPIDEGRLILSGEQKERLLKDEPNAAKYVRRYMGGDEFLNNVNRYCLWLMDCPPETLRKMPKVLELVESNREYRLSSGREATRKLAQKPGLFGEIRQPKTNYLLIPKVSSENRNYIPIGFCTPDIVASGTVLIIPNATLFEFGILQSMMHFVWIGTVCGRMKSDFVYSAGIVYNNFPWPENISEEKVKAIEQAAQSVLDVRLKYIHPHPNPLPEGEGKTAASLADLYDPLTMPADLVKAHQDLDRAVDLAYTRKIFKTDAERLEFLFELYKKYTKIQEA